MPNKRQESGNFINRPRPKGGILSKSEDIRRFLHQIGQGTQSMRHLIQRTLSSRFGETVGETAETESRSSEELSGSSQSPEFVIGQMRTARFLPLLTLLALLEAYGCGGLDSKNPDKFQESGESILTLLEDMGIPEEFDAGIAEDIDEQNPDSSVCEEELSDNDASAQKEEAPEPEILTASEVDPKNLFPELPKMHLVPLSEVPEEFRSPDMKGQEFVWEIAGVSDQKQLTIQIYYIGENGERIEGPRHTVNPDLEADVAPTWENFAVYCPQNQTNGIVGADVYSGDGSADSPLSLLGSKLLTSIDRGAD